MNETANFKYHDLLIELGFEHVNHGIYTHSLIDDKRFFDFSASSKQGIVYFIFQQGITCGKSKLQKEFKNLLDIKEI